MDQKRGSLAMKISSKIEHKNKEKHVIFNGLRLGVVADF
jgi:hypothetical protein